MILAVLSGILFGLSMPGYPLHPLIWISMVPLFLSFDSRAILNGVKSSIFFATALAVSHFWLLDTITVNFPRFAGFSPFQGFLVFLLFIAYESIFYFPFGFFGTFGNPYLVYPSLYVLIEVIRSIGDLGFTGARASDALFRFPHLVVISSVFGDLGLSFLVILTNVFLSDLFRKGEWLKIALAISLIHLPWAFFPDGIALPPEESWQKVWIYQTDEKPEEKYLKSLKERLEELPKTKGLLITPEAYIATFLEKPPKIEGDYLLGTLYRENGKRYNSALLLSAGKSQRYDKVKLFPFAEFLPYPKIFSFLKFLRGFSYYSPGEYHVLDYKGRKIGVLICFESYFEDGVLRYSKEADFVIVMTNDAWFRFDQALWSHFSKAVFRAAESGRWIVQVANHGISGVVDGFGRIRTVFPVGKKVVKEIGVGKPHPTLYPRIRTFLFFANAILLFIGYLTAPPSRSRALSSPYRRSRGIWTS